MTVTHANPGLSKTGSLELRGSQFAAPGKPQGVRLGDAGASFPQLGNEEKAVAKVAKKIAKATREKERAKESRTTESQSKPGTKMVYPEPCTGLRRRPQLFMVGIVPY